MLNSEQYYAALAKIEIETISGAAFAPNAPSFDINVIAHASARKCRFNGQCRFFYPVASHQVMVSRIMAQLGGDPFEGLMHDGNESYLPDVPSPYKPILPDVCNLENHVDARLREAFGLPAEKSSECKYADVLALMVEAHYLMPSRGVGPLWAPLADFHAPAMALIRQGYRIPQYDVPPAVAQKIFLERFAELCANR